MKLKACRQKMSWKALVVLSAIIGASHVSIAAETSPGEQAAPAHPLKFQATAANNKGLVTTLSTSPSDMTEKVQDGSKAVLNDSKATQMGGVSDGGGNAVGQVLFDFYENQDSAQISIEQLVALEPQTQQMLQKLDQQLPAIGDISQPGLGSLFIEHLKPKKIYLESKPLTSEGCLNQSMVAASAQVIVACQSDTELRINKQWLESTDSKNRAGLILHEMALAWLREELKNKFDKKDIEQKVRELNRAIFYSKSSDEMATAVKSITGVKAFSTRNYALAKALPSKLMAASEVFCKNPKQSPRLLLKNYFEDTVLFAELPWEIIMMDKTANNVNGYQTLHEEKMSEMRTKRLCLDYLLDQHPVEKPGSLSNCSEFEKDTLKQADLIANYTKGSIGLDDSLKTQIIATAIEKISLNAYSCYKRNGDSDAALYLLPQAVKWNLKAKEGIDISFVKRTAE